MIITNGQLPAPPVKELKGDQEKEDSDQEEHEEEEDDYDEEGEKKKFTENAIGPLLIAVYGDKGKTEDMLLMTENLNLFSAGDVDEYKVGGDGVCMVFIHDSRWIMHVCYIRSFQRLDII